jgi:gliding motility-associated-like protein
VVTAQDGTSLKTYTVTVYRAPSAIADLSALTMSSGTLTPAFASGTTVYTTSVSNTISSVTVSPTVSDATATIKVNGITVANGSTSGSIALAVGNNSITTAVTAEDGITNRTYTVTVNRALSANADLSALYLSSGTLSPVFAPGILSYTSFVSNATSSFTLTSRLSDAAATLIVNGTTVNKGNSNSLITLDFGANVINVEVLAPDNTTRKVYIVIVNREAPLKVQLSGLILSAGDLSPIFSASNTNYTSIVENSTKLINLTATAADDNTVIKVNGSPVENGSKSNDIVLIPGPNTIRIDVIAQNGLTNTYIIVVTRKASPNAELSELLLDNWTLLPAFSSNVLKYGATVDHKTNSISIKGVAVDSAATILIDGKTVGTGTVRGTLVLKTGDNLINITVVARDGTTKIYTVNVNRVTAEVNPFPQTIIFTAITSKTYGDPQFSLAASASSGLPVSYFSSDTAVAIIANGTLLIKGAGNADITAFQNGNFQYLAAKPVVQRLEVAKANLTIIAQNNTKTSGSENPVLSVIFSGFVNSENSKVLTAQPVVSTTATRSSPEGNYPIFVSGASATNYIISYNEGLLIVTPPQLVIMSINNVMTPNGDGVNDNFVIKNLDLNPDNNVIIFDRSGREVFRKQNYTNDWNGTMNGSFLREGTYYYIIDLGPGLKRLKGFVSIVN